MKEWVMMPPYSTWVWKWDSVKVPYSLRRVCGFFNLPQIYYMYKGLWDGAYGLSSLSEKTRKSNRLQMLLQRQHFLLSYLKTLSVGPAGFEPTTPPPPPPASMLAKGMGRWTISQKLNLIRRCKPWVLRVTNINFLPTMSVYHQEKRFWELWSWSPKEKMLWSSIKLSQLVP